MAFENKRFKDGIQGRIWINLKFLFHFPIQVPALGLFFWQWVSGISLKPFQNLNDFLVPAADFQIMREVYKALQRPEQVRRSAFDFVAKHIPSRRYLAVHWRFEGSLMEGGKTQSICKTKTNVRCQKIMNLYASPDLIVRKIRRQLALWQLNVSF